MILLGVLLALEVAALVGAGLLARRQRTYRLVVLLVAGALVDELLVEAGHRWVFPGAPRPFAGWVRVAYHVETALVLGWPALLAGVSWRVFLPLRRTVRRAIAGAWAATAAAFAAAFPLPRGMTAPALHVAVVVAATAALAPIPGAWRRAWTSAHVAVLVLVGVELAVALAGPWIRSPFTDWHLAHVAYVIGFGTLTAIQAHWLRRSTPERT